MKTNIVKNNHAHKHMINMLFLWVFGFMSRMFMRIFFLPFYAMMVIPFIILIAGDGTDLSQNSHILFRAIALLAFKPNATSLDEGDLAQAVLIVIAALELFSTLKNRAERTNGTPQAERKRISRTRLYVQCVVAMVGWTAFGISQREVQEGLATAVLISLGIVNCAFFWMEYSLQDFTKQVLNAFKQ